MTSRTRRRAKQTRRVRSRRRNYARIQQHTLPHTEPCNYCQSLRDQEAERATKLTETSF